MKKIIKNLINGFLKSINLQISHIPITRVSGMDLFQELKLIISTESPVVFDVGANIGQTVTSIREVLPRALIHSFEPSRATFEVLIKNFGGDSKVIAHNFALGETHDFRDFINYSNSCLNSFLHIDSDKSNRYRDENEKSREKVLITTLDDFVNKNEISAINLLKIDTQGYDLQVLKGANESFNKKIIHFVLIELNFENIYINQSSSCEISQFLADKGLFLIDYYEKVRAREGNVLAWCTALYGRR